MSEHISDSETAVYDMVMVTTVPQPVDATAVQVLLGSYGIDSELDGEMTLSANPLLSNAIGGVRILVAPSDLKRASEILVENQHRDADEIETIERTCINCGCTDAQHIDRPIWFAMIAIITFGAFCLLYPWTKYKCPECGHTW